MGGMVILHRLSASDPTSEEMGGKQESWQRKGESMTRTVDHR